ncbi:MAG: family 16 glycosylhydrolase, partial [Muribaculaceae bacterium]|nr:family 16 glycosylhydrolase [Muribaculaceae bacterium]
ADWGTLRPSGGLKNVPTEVSIAIKANSSMDERATSINIISGGKTVKTVVLTQGIVAKATPSTTSMTMGGQESSSTMTITANAAWALTTDSEWLTVSPSSGNKGETVVTVKATENTSASERSAKITLTCGESKSEIKVSQMSDAVTTPEGYTLVWADEFNGGPALGSDWVAENWPAGYVNNELQIYTSRPVDGKSTLVVADGFLNINCFKASDGKIYSGRVNAKPSTGWLYGYFEARILLPKGKGTWPAFWMMPANVDWNTNPWPKCGEIDIMEEVGANPDYVSSSIHTQKYNHTLNTQKTHEMKCDGAETSFHVYALEWTADEITTYVDGKVQLKVSKAALGADHD